METFGTFFHVCNEIILSVVKSVKGVWRHLELFFMSVIIVIASRPDVQMCDIDFRYYSRNLLHHRGEYFSFGQRKMLKFNECLDNIIKTGGWR